VSRFKPAYEWVGDTLQPVVTRDLLLRRVEQARYRLLCSSRDKSGSLDDDAIALSDALAALKALSVDDKT
jgi:hypothetical protein